MTGSTRSQPPSGARSFLYVPGDASHMLAKALTRGADAVIVDLEDGVSRSAKVEARTSAAAWISKNSAESTELWVRVNPSVDLLREDLDAVVRVGLEGVYLPKASSADDKQRASTMIDELEEVRNLPRGTVSIVPLLETAAAILGMPTIAAAPRVAHMAIGEADLAADLGMHPSPDSHELNSMRTSLVVASSANGLNRPIGPVHTAFEDVDSLRTTSIELRRMGYRGRAAVHPIQVPVINEAFSATQGEVDAARDILERFESARAGGSAVTVAEDGSLIDEAIVRQARVTLGTVPSTGDSEQ
jgi:citrate lyase subunit beta/citryl-CoA lyase